MAAVLSLLLLEGGARLWLTRVASPDDFVRYASLDQLRARSEETGQGFSRYARHLYVGFVGSPGWERGADRHNALGFRGDPVAQPKPPGEFRIACLGGSTTYTSAVHDHRRSFPSLLEADLARRGYRNVRVINAGLPGWTSYETLVNFQFRVLDLEPDLIIVYHAINDLLVRLVWPPAAYRGDNSGAKRAGAGLDTPPPWPERSTALRMLLIRFGWAESPGALEQTFVRHAPHFRGFEFMRQVRQGDYPSGIFRKTGVPEMLERNPPIYFQRNLEHLVVLAKHHGVQPVLATFASVAMPLGGDASSTPEIRAGIEEMNDVVRRVGSELEVPVFEFAERFPEDPRLFVGGVHVNEKGARLKAELFADFLVETALLPRP